MAKAAGQAELSSLHKLVAEALSSRIQQDITDDLPTDAATLGAAIKFLKDNGITADPADADDLDKLREDMKAQQEARRNRSRNVLSLAKSDLQVMEG